MKIFEVVIICVIEFVIFLWYHNRAISDTMRNEHNTYSNMKRELESKYQIELDRLKVEHSKELAEQVEEYRKKNEEEFKTGYILGYKDASNKAEPYYPIDDL